MTDDELDDWLETQLPLTNHEKAEILYGYLCAILSSDGTVSRLTPPAALPPRKNGQSKPA